MPVGDNKKNSDQQGISLVILLNLSYNRLNLIYTYKNTNMSVHIHTSRQTKIVFRVTVQPLPSTG